MIGVMRVVWPELDLIAFLFDPDPHPVGPVAIIKKSSIFAFLKLENSQSVSIRFPLLFNPLVHFEVNIGAFDRVSRGKRGDKYQYLVVCVAGGHPQVGDLDLQVPGAIFPAQALFVFFGEVPVYADEAFLILVEPGAQIEYFIVPGIFFKAREIIGNQVRGR